MTQNKIRKRAVQKRAEETRQAILSTALHLFSTRGYDGTTISTIESESAIKRGLVAYHFGDKETLWKQTIDSVFANSPVSSPELLRTLQDLPKESQIRAHLTSFVQFSARYPEINRILIQEGRIESWRSNYLVENHVKPRFSGVKEIFGEKFDAHTVYIVIGASTLIFDVEVECEGVFGFNPRDEDRVREHAKRVCDFLLGVGPKIVD